ncbi:legumain-like [Dendronephthya gigantea]|uniref:legumain-like n=1 Tax=Dendronephthya gigantea TaxID=151771 RepID=UPI00106B7BC1|nr:legumain-like [Dendronephthya gigantea]
MKSACCVIAVLVCVTVLARNVDSKTWGLLIAGSNTWDNYRHQADICHAYQILHRNQIPDENIVVMMYDDIAQNPANPTPGKIINKPNGPDVYHGVPKDYTGKDVTPKNFLSVLKGDKDAVQGIGSGKVIDSGPDDNVFVYFADHGAPGLVAFPGVAPPLKKKQLLQAINFMHQKNKYKQMVIYVEACESGSMFADGGLPNNIKVFATTAANPRESSYAYYWDNKRDTYLGDLYSISWMENSDKSNLTSETLQQQFLKVKKRTTQSHVQEYGEQDMSADSVIDFQGEGKESWLPAKDTNEYDTNDAVPSPEVPMAILEHRLEKASSSEKVKIEMKMLSLLRERQRVRETVEKIAEVATHGEEQKFRVLEGSSGKVTELDCHAEVVDAFHEKCFALGKSDAALRHVYVLANLCEEKIPLPQILSAINESC